MSKDNKYNSQKSTIETTSTQKYKQEASKVFTNMLRNTEKSDSNKPLAKSVGKHNVKYVKLDLNNLPTKKPDPVTENIQQEKPVEREPVLEYPEMKSFDDMGIQENILRGICSYGFEKPSRIQSIAIKPMMEGRDMVAQSQSGTGKTGTFTIGVLCRIDTTKNYPQAIIMCNTHELASQIQSVITDLGKYINTSVALCIGGIPVSKNMQQCEKSHVLIGTPGRIKDLISRNAFDVSKINIFVIDEADELLTREFFDQTKEIIQILSRETQICIFSATLPDEVLDMTRDFMTNPVHLLVQREKLTLDLITQYYVDIGEERNKAQTLEDLYGGLSINQCIIYVNNINKAEMLKDFLRDKKHEVETIHSGLDHSTRLDVMKRFRKAAFRVLISTDMTSRGIDVQQVSYVINYDLPFDVNAYLHRIGRSGRYGKKGVAINFVTNRDFHVMKRIERHYGTKIQDMPDPTFLNNYLTSL